MSSSRFSGPFRAMDTFKTENLMTNMSNDDLDDGEEELIPLLEKLE